MPPVGRDDRKTIGVLLADDHRLVREGVRALLDREADIRVLGEAADGEGAVEMALRLRPDVVVMDVGMPVMSGIEAIRRILQDAPGMKIVALSMHDRRETVTEALQAGAAGYLLKDCAHDELAHAVRLVHANLAFLSPQLADAVLGDPAGHREGQPSVPVSGLSPRERQVLGLLAGGKSTRDIATALGVSPKTVETHRRKITLKLGLGSIAALTKSAIQLGLTGLDA